MTFYSAEMPKAQPANDIAEAHTIVAAVLADIGTKGERQRFDALCEVIKSITKA
jgi:hypothetical protein